MLWLFAAAFLFGTVLIGASLLSSADHESGTTAFDDVGLLAVFSLRNLTWASFAFGGIGLLAVLTQRSPRTALLSATMAGVVTLAAVYALFTFVRRGEAGDLPSDALVFGTPAELVLPFDEHGLGTIRFVASGQVREMPARRSDDAADLESAHFTDCRIESIDRGIAVVHPAS